MDFKGVLEKIKQDDKKFANKSRKDFLVPKYSACNHYLDLSSSPYYLALIYLRDIIKSITDFYFKDIIGAKNIDLFMLTPSISSPMAPGSDSEAIVIKFGNLETNLVDSSQFGFEPLLLNDLEKVYCYMPSMRGEDPDKRHLNQFFHCELEIKGDILQVKKIAQDYIKILSKALLQAENIVNLISSDPDKCRKMLKQVAGLKDFLNISFDEAVYMLEKAGKEELINYTKQGRDICFRGEIELFNLLKVSSPIWLNNFDRDRVPFYQKPCLTNSNKVINADLLVPPLIKGSFGGEVLGLGQRQNNPLEMRESLSRQGINSHPYEWYINLRKQKDYQITSGFGMGVERFISWILGFDDIKNAIIYPRLKNIKTYP